MKITLNELYNYVYGDKAKTLPSIGSHILSHDAQVRKKEQEESNKQRKRDAFAFITNDPTLSLEFRILLRAENSSDLEMLLFGDNTAALSKATQSVQYEMPASDAIKARFATLNQEYGYFTGDPNAADLFIRLFKVSKLVADYVEKNNTYKDNLAYLHAYKLMVLFDLTASKTPLHAIDDYMGKYYSKELATPIHDALVVAIPKNSLPLKRLNEWRKLIKQKGPVALQLFQQAPELEAAIEKEKSFVFTLGSIRKIAAQIIYQNADANPELAILCKEYTISEEIFNRCLMIKPKLSDNLPNVIVDGNTTGNPGYYLLKLPINDPRAYILGHITHCCQSIGGHSEQCVIDGLTLEKNGFYVLLKAKAKGAETSKPIDQDKINYNDYDLVGQGYLWLSCLNNLTFDSWENANKERDDAVIASMLPAFAGQCFEQNPVIGCLTIGLGGGTPRAYASAKCAAPEKMAEGSEYGDASSQALIAMNPVLAQQAEKINTRLEEIGLPAASIRSVKQALCYHALLSEETVVSYQRLLGKDIYRQLLQKANNSTDFLFLVLWIHKCDQLNEEVTQQLLSSKLIANDRKIGAELMELNDIPDLMNKENVALVMQHPEYSCQAASALVILHKINPDLRAVEYFNILFQGRNFDIFTLLRQINPALITAKNIQLLKDAPGNTLTELSFLHEERPALITNENFELLVQQSTEEDVQGVIRALLCLYEESPSLINERSRKLLRDGKNAMHHTGILFCLHHTNPALMTDENIDFFIEQKFDVSILEGLIILFNANPMLITEENKNLLMGNSRYSSEIAKGWLVLYKNDPELLTEENKELFINDSYSVMQIVSIFDEVNPALITNENIKQLARIHEFSYPLIRDGLSILHKTSPSLITKSIYDLLTLDPFLSQGIANLISTLYDAEKKRLRVDQIPLKDYDNEINFIKSRAKYSNSECWLSEKYAGKYLLVFAIKNGEINLALDLIAPDGSKTSDALHEAMACKQVLLIQKLLELTDNSKPNQAAVRDVLVWATQNQEWDVMQQILMLNTDNKLDEKELSELSAILNKHSVEVAMKNNVSLFIKELSQLSLADLHQALVTKNADGWMPLHLFYRGSSPDLTAQSELELKNTNLTQLLYELYLANQSDIPCAHQIKLCLKALGSGEPPHPEAWMALAMIGLAEKDIAAQKEGVRMINELSRAPHVPGIFKKSQGTKDVCRALLNGTIEAIRPPADSRNVRGFIAKYSGVIQSCNGEAGENPGPTPMKRLH